LASADSPDRACSAGSHYALRRLSDSDHASIDEQFDRIDEAAVVRGEKYDGFGDFVRFALAE
jgi:hypothetical protein